MSKVNRPRHWLFAVPRFGLGNRVLVHPGSKEGVVTGIRYGEIAYDVRCGTVIHRNLVPELIRLTPPRLAALS
jgi:hypothetical protein